jgi:helix-turn-helix protein
MRTNEYPLIETLSEPSAAKVLGVSQMSLRRERNRGNISYYRVGRRVLYTPGQIADYLASVERKRIE